MEYIREGDPREATVRSRLDIGFDGLKERWMNAEATLTADTLTICGHPVMERWENDYMKALARIAATNGGTVLEVGFGMGISAGFLQTHDIQRHIVIEANRDVFKKVRAFAATARVPMQTLFGFWEEVTKTLPDESVSGILFDTYPLRPEHVHRNHFPFFDEAFRLLKPDGILTYYSDEISDYSSEHLAALRNAGFSRFGRELCPVSPPKDCAYWKSPTLLCPIVIK